MKRGKSLERSIGGSVLAMVMGLSPITGFGLVATADAQATKTSLATAQLSAVATVGQIASLAFTSVRMDLGTIVAGIPTAPASNALAAEANAQGATAILIGLRNATINGFPISMGQVQLFVTGGGLPPGTELTSTDVVLLNNTPGYTNVTAAVDFHALLNDRTVPRGSGIGFEVVATLCEFL